MFERLEHRYADRLTADHRQRLAYELDVVEKTGFPPYFLIVWDFIDWAEDTASPSGRARGSPAGSIVPYSLGITDIDPLGYDLLFERFLNPGRKSMPDIDIDFAVYGRDEVIQYVADSTARDHVAQIITFGTHDWRARPCATSAARSTSRRRSTGSPS